MSKLTVFFKRDRNCRGLRAISILKQQPEPESLYLALLGKGLIHWELGEELIALENINLSIDANPNFATAFHNKAWLLMDLERYEEALNAIEKAIAIEKQNANYYAIKGQILASLEQYRAAETAYTKAIALSPCADLHNIRGLINFKHKNGTRLKPTILKQLQPILNTSLLM